MYPKVKVRTDESGEDDHHEHNWSSLLSLKDIQFLLLQDPRFPVKEYRDVSPLPIARIPSSYVPNVVLPTELPSQEPDNKSSTSTEEEDKPKVRASSVSRPRAVISSPDNDALVANKNKVKALRPSALKRPNVIQSRHEQCKVAPSQATDGWNATTKCTNTTTDKKINLRQEKGSATALSNHRRNGTATKPSFVTN
ncbi:uncharacterized protein LOC126667976 [Mercurialis annua]|uniref:uncharacterized protein LOC126667976 n=1 Tax=Mercurialis annua TaxID=3986 RepID=UPI002160454D|nr:uncharacterized protein LOC126667976 [Mercurialis annua]